MALISKHGRNSHEISQMQKLCEYLRIPKFAMYMRKSFNANFDSKFAQTKDSNLTSHLSQNFAKFYDILQNYIQIFPNN